MVGIEAQENPSDVLMQTEIEDVRLEMIGDRGVWEFSPSLEHQETVDEIRATIRGEQRKDGSPCGCHHYADIEIQLPDGSRRRPDIAIFCVRPPRTRLAVRQVPAAVVEVLSPRGEWKDLELGPPNYLSNGVEDVIVIHPESGLGTWFRRDGQKAVQRGQRLALDCGCVLTL